MAIRKHAPSRRGEVVLRCARCGRATATSSIVAGYRLGPCCLLKVLSGMENDPTRVIPLAPVVEPADTSVSKADAFGREGSTPSWRTDERDTPVPGSDG